MAENVEEINGIIVSEEEDKLSVKLTKPYEFEGVTYRSINMHGLENLTGADLIKANKIMTKAGTFEVLPELSMEYCCRIAALACKLPYEFFLSLDPASVIKVKNRVTAFFYGAE